MPEVNVLHPGNPINEETPQHVRGRSNFPQRYKVAGTYRFGEIAPFMVKETIPNSHYPLRSAHELRTMNLKSPLMSGLTMHKDFFAVPMEAILPLNWDKIYTNPVIGDDVPSDVNCNIDLTNFVNAYISAIRDLLSLPTSFDASKLTSKFKSLAYLDIIFSEGSLASSLGLPLWRYIRITENENLPNPQLRSASYLIDKFMNSIFNEFDFDRNNIVYKPDRNSSDRFYIRPTVPDGIASELSGVMDFRMMFDSIKDNLLTFTFDTISQSASDQLNEGLQEFLSSNWSINPLGLGRPDSPHIYKNIAPILAYQLCCSHFYTNDHVDYIYSANLFRQYIGSILHSEAADFPTFNYNGIDYQYDLLSGHTFNYFVHTACLSELCTIFSFRHSLKFIDFFTGAKTQPLAVGNTDIAVNNNAVSVIDVTKNIQLQRFLNAVNRTGRKFSQYVQGLFGNKVAYDYHDPKYLGTTTDGVSAIETQNTGSDQLTESQTTTSNLRTNASRYVFEFESDRPSIILGLMWFDVPRFYTQVIDPIYNHRDRFEMFNPDLQFIGDQPIYQSDLVPVGDNGIFGYTGRYKEYKQSVNVAFGGFINDLPSWIFKVDDTGLVSSYGDFHLSPGYIRSRPHELDKFFISLNGYGTGTYYHFIVINDIDYEANIPAVVDPQIL